MVKKIEGLEVPENAKVVGIVTEDNKDNGEINFIFQESFFEE